MRGIATKVGHAEQRPDHLRGSAGFSRCHRGRGDPTAQAASPLRCYHACRLGAEAAVSSEPVERRLTAILAADVAGYSRLTGLDEEGTHARLQDHLRSLIDPKIAEHRGRVVENTGDGLLAEFTSVVDAVRGAWKARLAIVNRALPPQ